MDEQEPTPYPTREELVRLLALTEQLYAQGGPATAQGLGAVDPDDWHGGVLAELDDTANMDPAVFAGVAARNGLDNAAGVRALVRLSAAKAASAALRYALGVSDPATGDPAGARTVLEEINTTQWWLRSG